MWSYYGSKSKVVSYYPPPKYGKIIEPFAGSAKYAMKYFDREVLLVDKYEVVIRLWKWLQVCSRQDILSLPILKEGDQLSNFTFDCEEQKIFMGFLTAQGIAKPQNTAVFRATTHRPNWIKYSLERMSKDIEKIRHWEIRLGSYAEIENQEATWFIDPPYQTGGKFYVHNEIDYPHLAEWSRSRMGEVIVCENTKADWLPFVPLVRMKGSKHRTTEAVFTLPNKACTRQGQVAPQFDNFE